MEMRGGPWDHPGEAVQAQRTAAAQHTSNKLDILELARRPVHWNRESVGGGKEQRGDKWAGWTRSLETPEQRHNKVLKRE